MRYNFTSFELLTANIELKKQQVIINPYKMFLMSIMISYQKQD